MCGEGDVLVGDVVEICDVVLECCVDFVDGCFEFWIDCVCGFDYYDFVVGFCIECMGECVCGL